MKYCKCCQTTQTTFFCIEKTMGPLGHEKIKNPTAIQKIKKI